LGMGGGANWSSKLNDGAGLGTRKGCDGVRLGSGSERFGVGSDGGCRAASPAGSRAEPGRRRPAGAGAAKGTVTGWQVGMPHSGLASG